MLFGLLCQSYFLNAQNDISGIWNTGEDETKIEIKRLESEWKGRVLSSNNSDFKPNTVVLRKLTKKGELWRGQIYAPKRNEWYNVEITQKENLLSLEVSLGFLSRTIEWERNIQ